MRSDPSKVSIFTVFSRWVFHDQSKNTFRRMILNFEPPNLPSLMTFSTLTLIFLLVLTLTPTPGRATQAPKATCVNTCGTGKSAKWVPYPFGFTPPCPIQLNCSSLKSTIKLGGFQVQNITPNGVLIDLPAKCNRSITSISRLFGPNYALSWNNTLLLQNCSKSLNYSCFIPVSPIESQLDIDSCGSGGDNISCYPSQRKPYGVDVLSFKDVSSSQCQFLFSSFGFGAGDEVESLVFQRLELEWWLNGGCTNHSCSKDGNCVGVMPGGGRTGYRCKCNDGFVGDGFVGGAGCRRDSNCNALKYMKGKCGGTTRVAVLVGGLVAGALLMAGLAILCYFYRRRSNSLRKRLSAKRLVSEAAVNSSVPMYQYKEIEKATIGFSEKQRLGIGAYGTVYAGKLNHDEWVAIKRIRRKDTDSIDQFMNEIKLLSAVSHPNLVRLLGCCIEEGEQILVYEFMPNGTLRQHLQKERGNGLPWTIRLTIASETANAIAHLHSVMNPPIYHRDIKSSNILLDFDYKSKVADFGLSRLGITESSHISTAPQGTPGYLDPQYHQYFHLSDKSDVYSFGVVLIEIITGLKVVDFSRTHSEVNLAALAVDRIGRGCGDEIIDPDLEPQRDAWTLTSINSVAELAFRCLAFHRDMRPTMMEVAEELNQIRLSAWVPSMYVASSISSFSSSEDGSEKSLGIVASFKKSVVQRVLVPQRKVDRLTSLAEAKDGSPVSVQDPWQSENNSPSTSSLLDNVVQ